MSAWHQVCLPLADNNPLVCQGYWMSHRCHCFTVVEAAPPLPSHVCNLNILSVNYSTVVAQRTRTLANMLRSWPWIRSLQMNSALKHSFVCRRRGYYNFNEMQISRFHHLHYDLNQHFFLCVCVRETKTGLGPPEWWDDLPYRQHRKVTHSAVIKSVIILNRPDVTLRYHTLSSQFEIQLSSLSDKKLGNNIRQKLLKDIEHTERCS